MEIRKTSRKRGLDYERRNRADFKKSSSDLIVGDWFECENNIYIKIDEKTNHLKYNAVDAETGIMYKVTENVNVCLLDDVTLVLN